MRMSMFTEPGMVRLLDTIHTKDESFLYDGYTGKIYSADKRAMKSLTELFQENSGGMGGNKHGLEDIQWPVSFQDYRKMIDTELETLVLQLTQRCNLACTYCVYSGHYEHMLKRRDEDMSYNVIAKSIDFFLAHSNPMKERSIIFYGGEPTLCFEQIKWAVAYVHERNAEKNIRFSISTNGLALDKKVLEWLSQYDDVFVAITLNGKEHDSYRLTASGQGSLSAIMNNLENIKKNNPDIWRNRTGFIANINEEDELYDLELFYRQLGIFPSLITKISTDHADCQLTEYLQKRRDLKAAKDIWLERYIERDNEILEAYYDTAFYEIHHRHISADGVSFIPSCLPMQVSVFVRTDGSFNMCTRVTDSLNLGNVYTGYQEESLQYLYEGMLKFANENCRTCWAHRVCRYCFQDIIDSNGRFYHQLPNDMCEKMRRSAHRILSAYCDILLSHPQQSRRWMQQTQKT